MTPATTAPKTEQKDDERNRCAEEELAGAKVVLSQRSEVLLGGELACQSGLDTWFGVEALDLLHHSPDGFLRIRAEPDEDCHRVTVRRQELGVFLRCDDRSHPQRASSRRDRRLPARRHPACPDERDLGDLFGRGGPVWREVLVEECVGALRIRFARHVAGRR